MAATRRRTARSPKTTTVDEAEVARFSALAEAWWDPEGEFRPLHRLNPVRLAYIRRRLVEHFGLDPQAARPLEGLTLLDVGCGGGLLSEPMARLGARVTGVDAAERNIGIAAAHARDSGLAIDYRHAAVEDLAAAGEHFDVVLALEIVEHVADPDLFLEACGAVLAPGGALVLATLNRTAKAFALAVVGAEYVLRWLPRGTHDWRKFLRPSELAAGLRRAGLELADLSGVAYNPLNDKWTLSRDLDVNYMAFAVKAKD
ncbi:MAG TPA: bifunctional 2-polyprenyl-6-hydroxyphenol methylase/3-demethylubiquinol 3-O-methyltransferase UbiG [Alphaproteobacteria bacterium]|jgi:2-polyprenyl-6-hydroxyphenyl methylase/3-demethylubiquinone-9 3-methyltransferase|nr:bifunctional 2-polyprenyl-6-hydroxyphenol methylase/3-demethylubiquinol 3-O-methyltransferase UbiG [Alphaproteobacteria bacterium]